MFFDQPIISRLPVHQLCSRKSTHGSAENFLDGIKFLKFKFVHLLIAYSDNLKVKVDYVALVLSLSSLRAWKIRHE